MSVALALVMTFATALAPFGLGSSNSGRPGSVTLAFAVTSAEKQAEVDAALIRLDALQTELNLVTADYDLAVSVHMDAIHRMRDAQEREEAALVRINELQEQLGTLAAQMYRSGPISFLDVIFGAKSFSDFVAAIDMTNRINAHRASLIAESRVMRDEAEISRIEFERQEQIAADKEAECKKLKDQQEAVVAEMLSEINALKSQAAELLVQEELEAAAYRQRLEDEARRAAAATSGREYVDPGLAARVPSLVFPCPGYYSISSPYGWRNGSFHLGTDFAAATGTNILAAAAGTVTAAGWQASMGNYVIINHGYGIRTIYMHASALYVYAGSSVYAGQVIAAVGSTGNSTGPHLHFQLEIDGQAVNPMSFL